jgi:DNA-binding transcriptional ArsR family regulator
MPPDIEAIAEQVFVGLADPTRRAILAALASGGSAGAGLVTAEPGERRRVRYRLRSAPMQVAQQFLAALARDWDGPLGALTDHLDRSARGPATTRLHQTRGHHG